MQQSNLEEAMNAIRTFVFAVAVALLAPTPSRAESGSVELLASTTSVLTSVQFGDTAVTSRGGSGIITFIKSSGGPFAEGASGTAQFVSFSKKSPAGLELEADGVATFSSEDILLLLFKRRTGDLAAGSSGEGTLQLTGQAGRFAGVSGQCKYKVDNLAGNWQVTIAKCQWSK
jgi:hypothetical protein